jgi:site-specific DNA-methyltransferase (adenine-specific)
VPDLATNVLYYGDNLDILRRYLPDAAVDLVYLDPPFNSNRDDNLIFRDESGNATATGSGPSAPGQIL